MLVVRWEFNHADVPVEPDKTLGGCVLLLLELVENEVLEGLGECGSSELAVTDFLRRVSYSPAIRSLALRVP